MDYVYDHLGRKISYVHNDKPIVKYEYDVIGRLKNKRFSPSGAIQNSKQTGNWTDVSTWLSGLLPNTNDNVTIDTGHTLTIPNGQIAGAGTLNDKGILRNFGTLNMGKFSTTDLYNESMSYHIRGGLRGINLDANNNLTNTLFSMKLSYEDDLTYFDGNIRKQEWKSNLDKVTRSFTYRYDGSNRIKAGVYTGTGGENYTLGDVTYDNNGNIQKLIRSGLRTTNNFGIVDNLNYTYSTNSNKILKVDDVSNVTASFADVAGNDYTYLADGSLKSDANKGITLMEYNYLKLPNKIVQSGVITLIQYSASGKKLKETIGTQVTDYVGNTIYKDNSLYQISHDEGRIINGEYEYSIKDHLGNLRVAFRDSLGIVKITQANSYGIFGEDLPTLNYLKSTWKKDFFKFTGKEELQGTGYIDFGARLYDPIVPRFTTIDPLAELSRRFSPTVYGNNNPLSFIDPDGMKAKGYTSISGYYSRDDGGGGEQEEVKVQDREDEQRTDDKDKDKKKPLPTLQEAMARPHLNPNGDGINQNLTIESVAIPIFRPIGWAYRAFKLKFLVNVAAKESEISLYAGVRSASKYLQEQGVSRAYRQQILQSFETETISLKIADNATYGLRFFGGAANETGRYLFPTFTNYTSRVGLALPPSWNSMTGIAQFQISEGSAYIFGRAVSQGGIYTGGSYQMYVNSLKSLIK